MYWYSVGLLCLLVSVLAALYLPVEPYMDEIFHVPQATAFAQRRYSHWDAKITTFPGLYIYSTVIYEMLACVIRLVESVCGSRYFITFLNDNLSAFLRITSLLPLFLVLYYSMKVRQLVSFLEDFLIYYYIYVAFINDICSFIHIIIKETILIVF